MWKKNITQLNKNGIFRSLNGAADENIFIGKALKAGFFCFFKAWRDMSYDAVLEYQNVLFRIEVKGSSTTSFDLSRGSRSGAQINRQAENRKRPISRNDCDFVVCVDSNNGDCYILPVDIIEISRRDNLPKSVLNPFKEKWHLLMHNSEELTTNGIKQGLLALSTERLSEIARTNHIIIPEDPIKPKKNVKLSIINEKEKMIWVIWCKLAE